MKGNTSGYSVTTGASGNKYRLVKNSDGTFRIMAVGSLNLISSNGVANSSNYATIEEYSSIDSMKWHFEPIVNKYFSEYTPDKFNSNIGNTPTILRMNCYGYAFSHILYYGEYRDAYKQQPGEFASASNLQYVVDNVIDNYPSQTMSNVVSNMQLDASRFGYSMTEYIPSGSVVEQFGADSRLVAVVSGATDYHFYMQHNDGTWSHKPGSGTVRNWSLASEVNHTYLTNNNIILEANQGDYENGSLRFFIITRDAVSDHPHAFALLDVETGLYYKDIAGDNKTTSTAIYASTTQECCFDCYDDVDYYVFIPLSSQNYTISTTSTYNHDIDGIIYDSEGNQIDYAVNVGQINKTFSAVMGKRYFIKIYNYDHFPGEYTVTIS